MHGNPGGINPLTASDKKALNDEKRTYSYRQLVFNKPR